MLKPVVLVILDGWGMAPPGPGNSISLAKTPNFNKLWSVYPKTMLEASGESVGLPKGDDGNSETGHLNLGAGRIVFQDLPRINTAIADGRFFKIPAFIEAVQHAKINNSSLHLMGLVGAGGVHSSLEHLFALLSFCRQQNLTRVWLHLFTDGRDSPPYSAKVYTDKIEDELINIGVGRIATICGRYYAMDRDYRWERTEKAYNLIVQGMGSPAKNASCAIKESYAQGKSDEFLEPYLINKNGLVSNHDTIIFFNFRIDRPRQLTKALVMPNFESMEVNHQPFDPFAEKYGLHQYQVPDGKPTFARKRILTDLLMVTMTEFEKWLPVKVAFPPDAVSLPLTRIISENGLRQFHLAETEKERFVTYYFDGMRETSFPGEDRVEIPSPKVSTYDQKPEMSAHEITKELLDRIKINMYDFVVVNFANPDMVGHTGVIKAGIKACEVVDSCLGKVVNTVAALGGVTIITADHGNVEEMINLTTGGVDTEHSSNPVPFIVVDKKSNQTGRSLSKGILADVAPTIMAIMEIPKPEIMTGKNLLI